MEKTMNSVSMTTEIINFFGIAEVSNNLPVDEKTYAKFATEGFQSGYYVHPACCTDEVYKFLLNAAYNPNATFWKTWQDVIERSQEELFFAQAIHYATTYGTDYTLPAYVPNNNYDIAIFTNLKPILPATVEEIAYRCYDVLQSGIALKSEVVAAFCEYIIRAIKEDVFPYFDINTIKNKEAMCMLAYRMNTMPRNPSEIVRTLIYAVTGKTMLIKSPEVIKEIKENASKYHLSSLLNENDMYALATCFYRVKPILLAFKSTDNSYIINKIRRLAKKYHKPMKANVFESILNPIHTAADVKDACMKETNIFKLLRVYSYLADEYSRHDGEYNKTFMIRNGKMYTRKYDNVQSVDRKTTIEIYMSYVYNKIVAMIMKYRIKSEHTSVILPKEIVLALPTSEKLFVGNIPFGSYMPMDKNNYFGVYWRNEWGTHDYDLSYCSLDGSERYGWNSYHKNSEQSVVFSGDMTNACPEAVEMFYCKDSCPDGLLYLNRYNGNPGSQARLFFGSEEIKHLEHNHMVNPDTIAVKADIFPQKRQTIVGGFIDNKAYFFNMEQNNSMVSSNVNDSDSLKRKMESYLLLHEVLSDAGYHVITEHDENSADSELDFSEYTKETLINFLKDVTDTFSK